MAPYPSYPSVALTESNEVIDVTEIAKWEIVWKNIVLFSILHAGALYGIYLSIFSAIWISPLFLYIYGSIGAQGVTAGAHRLWSHRSYKAKWPLRVLLIILNSIAAQYTILGWCREHRMHHKYADTDADPHNATRGFFFSHMGWLMLRKHPQIKAKGHTVDISDLWADPVLRFQKKYYAALVIIFSVVVPTYIPTYWGETKWNAFFVCVMFRYVLSLHFTWLVNSAAHMWGYKPYDKKIKPSDNKLVAFLAYGEGFHNYHHVYPWDYKTAELGHYSLNVTKIFIDTMAVIGWAYDLKTVSPEVIGHRQQRTGDLHMQN